MRYSCKTLLARTLVYLGLLGTVNLASSDRVCGLSQRLARLPRLTATKRSPMRAKQGD